MVTVAAKVLTGQKETIEFHYKGTLELNQTLRTAVKKKELEVCRKCLEAGGDATFSIKIDPNNDWAIAKPLLHLAVIRKDKNIVRLLLQYGADINQMQYRYNTHCFDYLVDFRYAFESYKLEKPAHFEERMDFLNFLFSHGCQPKGNVLGVAIFSQRLNMDRKKFILHGGNNDVCKWLAERGCGLDSGSDIGMDRSPIVEAGLAGESRLVKLLVRHGVNLGLRKRNGILSNANFIYPLEDEEDFRRNDMMRREDILINGVYLNPLEAVIKAYLNEQRYLGTEYERQHNEWRTKESVKNALQVIETMLLGGSKVFDSTITLCRRRLEEEHKRKHPRENALAYMSSALEMLTSPLSLQSICRIAVRGHAGKSRLDRLNELTLPQSLRRYLDFSEMGL